MRKSIDMRRLEQFVTVAHARSLGKAATQLALSQPTLTRNMRGLESEVGAKLFERGPLGTVLTRAGERFLPRAEALLNGIERALAELDEEGSHAHLKIGVSPSFFFNILPEAIGRLVAVDPSINVHLVSGTRETIADDLRRNAVDFGLCLIPDFFYTAASEASEITFEALGEERILPYVRAGHPAAAARELRDVTDYRWAVPHQVSVSYRFESAFYRNHLPVPVQSLNAASLSLIRTAALEYNMVSLLPARFAADDVRRGVLMPVQIAALHFDFVLGMVQRIDTRPSTYAATMIGLLRELIARGD